MSLLWKRPAHFLGELIRAKVLDIDNFTHHVWRWVLHCCVEAKACHEVTNKYIVDSQGKSSHHSWESRRKIYKYYVIYSNAFLSLTSIVTLSFAIVKNKSCSFLFLSLKLCEIWKHVCLIIHNDNIICTYLSGDATLNTRPWMLKQIKNMWLCAERPTSIIRHIQKCIHYRSLVIVWIACMGEKNESNPIRSHAYQHTHIAVDNWATSKNHSCNANERRDKKNDVENSNC